MAASFNLQSHTKSSSLASPSNSSALMTWVVTFRRLSLVSKESDKPPSSLHWAEPPLPLPMPLPLLKGTTDEVFSVERSKIFPWWLLEAADAWWPLFMLSRRCRWRGKTWHMTWRRSTSQTCTNVKWWKWNKCWQQKYQQLTKYRDIWHTIIWNWASSSGNKNWFNSWRLMIPLVLRSTWRITLLNLRLLQLKRMFEKKLELKSIH